MTDEIPSDDDVVAALHELGGSATAVDLYRALTSAGHSAQLSQIAIQRAAERGKINVDDDWKLSVAQDGLIAA